MKIIAFGHRKGVGKDTATNFLTSELRLRFRGINIKKAGFADKVKDVSYQLFGWAGLQPGYFYDENYKMKEEILPLLGKTPRELWIGTGNGLRSFTCDDIWLKYLFKSVLCDILIISDLRFPAEAQGIIDEGGFCYRIDRQSCVDVVDGADDRLADFQGWTGTIDNNGSLKDLHMEMVKLIDQHFNVGDKCG